MGDKKKGSKCVASLRLMRDEAEGEPCRRSRWQATCGGRVLQWKYAAGPVSPG